MRYFLLFLVAYLWVMGGVGWIAALSEREQVHPFGRMMLRVGWPFMTLISGVWTVVDAVRRK